MCRFFLYLQVAMMGHAIYHVSELICTPLYWHLIFIIKIELNVILAVEIYYPEEDEWKVGISMIAHEGGIAAGVLTGDIL